MIGMEWTIETMRKYDEANGKATRSPGRTWPQETAWKGATGGRFGARPLHPICPSLLADHWWPEDELGAVRKLTWLLSLGR
eukprot:scaffold386944_cov16-Prasinocladus_malaysianus.AAC.1